MQPPRRPNSSLYLLATALVLALAFSVWCINLAGAVQTLRRDILTDEQVLTAIDDLRAIMVDLDAAAVPDGSDPPAVELRWRDASTRSAARLDSLGDRARFSAVALAQLAVIESALGPLAETGRHPDTEFAGAVAALRGERASISEALGRKWASLNVLALLSVLSVVVVVVLLYRAQVESARHRRAQRNLRESKTRFRSVLSAIPDVILVLSASGEYREIFTATPKQLVDPTDNLVGQNIHTRLPRAIASDVQAVIDRTIETGRMQTLEYPLTIGGHDKWFAARTVPFGSARDPCVLWVARDMTEQRREEQRRRASEDKLSSIIDTASEAVIVSDHQGIITLWNKASEKIFGHSAEEAVGQKIRLIVPERFREAHDAGMRRMAVHGTNLAGQMLDLTAVRKDGSEFPAELSFTVRRTGDRRFITGIVRDVTERKQAETALRESEQRFRSAFDDTGVGMVLTELDGRFVRANRSFCRMTGYSEQELCTRTFRDITHPDDVAKSVDLTGQLTEGERSDFTVEKRYVHRDGHTVWAQTSASIVRDATGKAQHLVGEIQDISERKRTEEALRQSEERFRSIFENNGVAMHTAAPDGRFLQVNRAFCRFLGYTEQEFLRLTITDITHPDDLPQTAANLAEVRAGRRNVTELVKRLVRKDGSVVWGNVTAVWLLDSQNRPVYCVGMIQDVTEQKRVEQDLLDTTEDLERRVVTRTADLMTANRQLTAEIADRKRAEAIQSGWNRVLQRLAADAPLPEVLTMLVETVEDVQPQTLCSVLLLDQDTKRLRHGAAPSLPDFYNEMVNGLEIGPGAGSCGTAAFTGERVIVEDVMTHPYWVPFRDIARRAELRACWSEPIRSSNGEILGTFAIYYREVRAPDPPAITLIASAAHLAGIAIERKHAEARLAESRERLRVSDRLASLGTLVAGLGHDMNNVLFPLRCRLDALNWDDLSENVREVLQSSHDSVEYLQQLSSGLRLFAADPLDTEATLEITSPAAWWGQVQPLISNMVPNNVTIHSGIPDDLPLITVAAHRLTQAVMNLVTNAAEAMPSGGEIRVRADADDEMHRVTLTVSDKGVGMTDEVRRHALDPFFTTKKRSLSTGLGLSLVLGVVRRSHGMITIDSAPGKGTTVRLVFPTAQATGAARRRPNGAQDRAAVTLRDQRTAAWVTNVLESAGYNVSVAEDGDPRQSDIWVTEASAKNLSKARHFLTRHDQRRIIVMGSTDTAWAGLGAVMVEDASNLDAIKSAVCEVTPVSS